MNTQVAHLTPPPTARLSTWEFWGRLMVVPYILVFLVFVVYPVCSASKAALLTGLHSHAALWQQSLPRPLLKQPETGKQFDRQTGVRTNTFSLPANYAISNLSAIGATEISTNASGGDETTSRLTLLLDVALAHLEVLSQPAPIVFFMKLGDSSLDLGVRGEHFG